MNFLEIARAYPARIGYYHSTHCIRAEDSWRDALPDDTRQLFHQGFGLTPQGGTLLEFDRNETHQILTRLFHTGLTPNTVIKPQQQAHELATTVLDSMPEPDWRYYSNAQWHKRDTTSDFTWIPATKHPIDGGVIIINEHKLNSFCFWIEGHSSEEIIHPRRRLSLPLESQQRSN